MAASVVDLPLPATPVTKTRPLVREINSLTILGRPSESSAGILSAMSRMAAAMDPLS